MNTLILFLIKSIIVSGILTMWYCLALRNKKLHNYNRFFLLFTLYASLQIPLLNFQLYTVKHAPSVLVSPASFLLRTIGDTGAGTPQSLSAAATPDIDYEFIVLSVAAMVSIVLLAILLLRIVWVLRIGNKYPHAFIGGIHVIRTDLSKAPFSFLNNLFWREDIPLESENGKLIFRHELTHIRQKHTYDKLGCQFLTCIFWMNPFYWFIQKELNMVHEFIADESAIEENDTATFAGMLLQTHNGGSYLTPGHQFFSSPIKRRLTMLQTNKKTRGSFARRFAILPLVACSVLIFSFTSRKESKVVVTKADKKIVLVVDAGHGGDDMGCSNGWLTEKELSLKVAKRIKTLSPDYNIDVHLTRSKDETLPLSDRVALSNKLHPDDFISLHVADEPGNDVGKGSFDIVVNSKNSVAQRSKELAWSVYKSVARLEWSQKGAPSEKSLFVLKNNNAPAMLIELGDIKNKEQMKLLTDDDKLDELCGAILRGVVEFHKG